MPSSNANKVLIIGGGGFLGYHATALLLERGYKVDILTLPPAPGKNLFDERVEVILKDVNDLDEQEAIEFFSKYYAIVFAAGRDDRITPKRPAFRYFYDANVASSERVFKLARIAHVKRGVLLSSYFAHFARVWPELNLEKHHPYIRSRIEQEEACLKASLPSLELVILELPYIFGAMPHYEPLWTPLVKYVAKSKRVFYSRGGTNMVGVEHVSEAIVGAIEQGEAGKTYLVGDENLTWEQFLIRLAGAMNREIRVTTLPDTLIKLMFSALKLKHLLQGKQGGLDPVHFVDLQTRETFFDTASSQKELGYHTGGLDKALRDTVKSIEHL